MFSAFQTFGRLGAGARAVAAAWSPSALWPTGTEPGMWIDPSNLTSQWQDSTGTTPVSTPGTVADSSNPVGLALDIRAGAPDTLGPELITGTPSWAMANWTDNGGRSYSSDGSGYLQFVGATAGASYEVTFDIADYVAGAFCVNIKTAWDATPWAAGSYSYIIVGATGISFYASGLTATINNLSVREVPGNHLLQATSTSRPLMSARVNLLQYTEDFSYGAVPVGLSSITGGSVLGPFGSVDGTKLTEDASTGIHYVRSNFPANIVAGATYVRSCFFKKGSGERYVQFGMTYGSDTFGAVVDLDSGAVTVGTTGVGTVTSASVTTVGGWFFCSVSGTMGPSITTCFPFEHLSKSSTYSDAGYTGDGTSFIYCFGRDFRKYSDSTVVYQSVPGDGSTYPSTGFPTYLKFDGTDDGMATASFAAGTLTSSMDCLIAVRRDSAASTILGLAAQAVDALGYFGACIPDTELSAKECGTPTVWVDGVQLSGGTAVTRGTLNTAMTVGDWHILEYRDLDLSAWTALHFARAYTGFYFNGGQGGILLFPSSTSTANRDAARTWLGAKVGLTL